MGSILNSNGGSKSSLSNKGAIKRNIQQQNIKSIHNEMRMQEKWYTLIDNLSETELKDAIDGTVQSMAYCKSGNDLDSEKGWQKV